MQENRYVCMRVNDFDLLPEGSTLEKEQFRYVRDDKNGVLIMIYDFPEEGYVRLEYMSHQSSICRLRSFCHINRNVLLKSISDEDGVLHAEQMFPAVTLFHAVHEYRPCPTCGATVDAPCSCQLDLVAPTHSLDFRNGEKHMSSHVGAFQGMANLQLFAKGNALKHTTLGCRIQVQGGSAPDLVSKLTNWAITEHLKEVPQNPMLSLLSLNGAELQSTDVDSPEVPAIGLSLGNTNFGADNVVDGLVLDGFLDPQVQESHDEEIDVIPESSDIMQYENWQDAEFSTCLFQSSMGDDYELREDSDHGQMSERDPAVWAQTITSQGLSILQVGMTQNPSIIASDERDVMQVSNRHLDLEFLQTSLTRAAEHTSEGLLSPPKPESMSQNSDLGTIWVLGGHNANVKQGSDGNKGILPVKSNSRKQKTDMAPRHVDENDDEKATRKELKKQLKRERNRASAKRSNTKKKHENDIRKRERQRLKELEVTLRAEEQRLRKENLTLRKKVQVREERGYDNR